MSNAVSQQSNEDTVVIRRYAQNRTVSEMAIYRQPHRHRAACPEWEECYSLVKVG